MWYELNLTGSVPLQVEIGETIRGGNAWVISKWIAPMLTYGRCPLMLHFLAKKKCILFLIFKRMHTVIRRLKIDA